jgi:hypothetical protein
VPTGADPVANGLALQAAINNANCGDTVVLQAGATYQGQPIGSSAFVLPYKPNCATGDFITIRTSNLAGISPEGTRIDPAAHAAAMPKLVADVSRFGMSVIVPDLYAHSYKLVGLEITNSGVAYGPNLLTIAAGTYRSAAELMGTHHFIIDRCFVHTAEISANNLFPSTLERTSGRGIQAEGVEITIQNSYIAGFAGYYPGTRERIDAFGIFTIIGPGPLHIINNYIEAEFANFFTGGGQTFTPNTATVSNPTLTSATLSNVNNLSVGDLVAFSSAATTNQPWETGQITSIRGNDVTFTLLRGNLDSESIPPDNGGTARWKGLNVSNVTIRGNTMSKPDAWNAFVNPKGWMELKDCVNCTIDGNYFYAGKYSGVALTPRNQTAADPWSKVDNFVFTNNIVRNYSVGLMTQGADDLHVSLAGNPQITMRNNLFISPSGAEAAAFLRVYDGKFLARNASVTHNTIIQPGTMLSATGVTEGDFIFKDNIVGNGVYGIQCFVNPSNIYSCLPGLQMQGNVIVGEPLGNRPYCTDLGSIVYPTGNNCVSDSGQVGFVDLAGDNYRLGPNSPFKGRATDGTDPGVDMDALLAAQGGAAPSATKAITITSPYDGQNVEGMTTVSAETSPSIQTAYVEFYLEGQLAGTSSSAPYSTLVDTRSVPNGARSLLAKAFDGRGYVGSSTPVSVSVYNPDVLSPTAAIISPANGTTVSGTIKLSASASDNVGVTRVEFVLDSAVLASSSTTSPFTVVIDTRTLWDGVHSIVAKAYDAAGNVSASDPISITVSNADGAAPTTSITSPTSGSSVSGTIGVTATASDNVAVTKVEFLVDDAVAGVSTASPYVQSLDTSRLSNGSHKLAGRAYDSSGNVGLSTPVSFSVNNLPSDTTAPSVTITAVVDGKGVVTLSANAIDNVGVARIEFFVDGKLNASDTSAPFATNLRFSGPFGSSHLLTARAYDAAGNVGQSSTITLKKLK